jgi:hypothetical protein
MSSRVKKQYSANGVNANVTISVDNKMPAIRKYLTELQEAGLRLAANYTLKTYRASVYSNVSKRTGTLKRYAKYKLYAKRGYVAFGFRQKAFYGKFFEFGKKKLPIAEPIIMGEEVRQIIKRTLKGLSNPTPKPMEGSKLPNESS